jgi:exocyst complex component 2
LLPVAVKTNSQKDQQRRIIDKVWSMVEKIVGEMRSNLLALLRDPRRSVEDQEKTIE